MLISILIYNLNFLSSLFIGALSFMTETMLSNAQTSYFLDASSSTIELPEYRFGHSPATFEYYFCQKCAHQCMHKNKGVFQYRNYICRRTLKEF